MKFRLLLASLILVIMSISPMWAADVAAGKDTFGKKCASCHGANGEGKDSIAKMMKVEFRHLGSKEVQAKSDAELMKIITEGGGKMKPVKDVDSKATEDIVSYLRTLRDKK
jgi:mono/diheme cytochrome c family protein